MSVPDIYKSHIKLIANSPVFHKDIDSHILSFLHKQRALMFEKVDESEFSREEKLRANTSGLCHVISVVSVLFGGNISEVAKKEHLNHLQVSCIFSIAYISLPNLTPRMYCLLATFVMSVIRGSTMEFWKSLIVSPPFEDLVECVYTYAHKNETESPIVSYTYYKLWKLLLEYHKKEKSEIM